MIDGRAPSKVISKVDVWIDIHEDELLSIWERLQNGKELGKISPFFRSYLTGSVFGELVDLDEFTQYGLTRTTVEWENGADLAAEFLYSIGANV